MQTHQLKRWSLSHSPDAWAALVMSAALGGALLLVGFFAWAFYLPSDRIAQGVQVEEVDLSGKTRAEASAILTQALPDPALKTVYVTLEDRTWQTDSRVLGLHLNREEMVEEAFQVSRRGDVWGRLRDRWNARWSDWEIEKALRYDSEKVRQWTNDIATDINTPGRPPQVTLQGSTIVIDEGERGLAVDGPKLVAEIERTTNQTENLRLSAPVEVTITPLSADGSVATQQRAEKLRKATLSIVADPAEPPLTVPASEFFSWLTWPSGFDTATLEAKLAEKTEFWNREPINAEFALSSDGKKLTAFAPHRMGRQLQLESLVQEVERSISELEQATELPPQPIVVTTQFVEASPDVTLESTNTLGIKERIAVGTSTYKGSIPNRIFNVGLTAERLHGSIVAPGEEFSFNQAVGEISGKTGYKSAYVIMNGRTQLGDGGGVCQVSTTLFRAILDGGLPVTRWKAHSYRVGYYEQGNQPGFDATVYAPSVDFRFRNDTGHSIAIAAYPDSTSQFLTVELWGTSDGRESEVSNYKIWNQRSAPAPSYIEDPSLPVGKRQQIDWAAAGANTSFQYTVKDASGAVIHDREFVSIFRPWQAVYLVGTGQ